MNPHHEPGPPPTPIDPIDAPHHLDKIRHLRKAVSDARVERADARDALFHARSALSKAERALEEYYEGLESSLPLFDRPEPEPVPVPATEGSAPMNRGEILLSIEAAHCPGCGIVCSKVSFGATHVFCEVKPGNTATKGRDVFAHECAEARFMRKLERYFEELSLPAPPTPLRLRVDLTFERESIFGV